MSRASLAALALALSFMGCSTTRYEGHVVDARTQEPIAGARVVVRHGLAALNPEGKVRGDSALAVARTDATGRFAVSVAAPDPFPHLVDVEADGYLTEHDAIADEGTVERRHELLRAQ